MQTFNLGDQVAVLHDTLVGTVVEVSGEQVTFKDEDGFLRTYPRHQVVIRHSAKAYKIESSIPAKDKVLVPGNILKKKIITPVRTDQFEIDLHIEELVDSVSGLSNYDIVQIQMRACRAFVQESIRVGRKKIVLIHGKGEGVLKNEIRDYLERLMANQGVKMEYFDASYQIYGQGGATEVRLG